MAAAKVRRLPRRLEVLAVALGFCAGVAVPFVVQAGRKGVAELGRRGRLVETRG